MLEVVEFWNEIGNSGVVLFNDFDAAHFSLLGGWKNPVPTNRRQIFGNSPKRQLSNMDEAGKFRS